MIVCHNHTTGSNHALGLSYHQKLKHPFTPYLPSHQYSKAREVENFPKAVYEINMFYWEDTDDKEKGRIEHITLRTLDKFKPWDHRMADLLLKTITRYSLKLNEFELQQPMMTKRLISSMMISVLLCQR